jgi:hypothetical protein
MKPSRPSTKDRSPTVTTPRSSHPEKFCTSRTPHPTFNFCLFTFAFPERQHRSRANPRTPRTHFPLKRTLVRSSRHKPRLRTPDSRPRTPHSPNSSTRASHRVQGSISAWKSIPPTTHKVSPSYARVAKRLLPRLARTNAEHAVTQPAHGVNRWRPFREFAEAVASKAEKPICNTPHKIKL